MRLPIVAMGAVCAVVATLLAAKWRDPVFAAVAVLVSLVTLGRLLVINAYQRHSHGPRTGQDLQGWERRYAIGNYIFACLIAILNVRALTYHDPLMHMITVSIVFGFGAGIVARISARPVICVISLLLATVPTVAALAWHASMPNAAPLHAQLFATEAVLVGMIAILSLNTVHYLHNSTVLHLVTQHDLALLAKSDALTGLPNRLMLRERFQESAATVESGNVALHYLDLDGFKAINDLHGHPAGDALLREAAQRMAKTLRACDMVARLGGDEFIILQTDLDHPDEAEMLARRLIRDLSAPYLIDGEPLQISASVGIALAADFGMDLERLLACADCALYRSKSRGKRQFNFATSADIGKLASAAA
ncbi:MAG: GGDEF domain-containing protein [Sphingomonas sp.]